MADQKLTQLSELTSATNTDIFYVVDDVGGTPTGKYITWSNIKATLLTYFMSIVDGRLTLESGVPVSVTDQTAKTTVYFTPYRGNQISLYDGSTQWDLVEFSEISVSVPATTVTPFDIFVYNNGGTATLETVDWTNDTTRATALTTQDGILVKSGATTRRYLGTGRTTGSSGECEDSDDSRFIWNYYNRVNRRMFVQDTGAGSHTYGTASWRSWNNDATLRVQFVVGVQEESWNTGLIASITPAAASALGYVGITLDGTSNPTISGARVSHGINDEMTGGNPLRFPPFAIGYHYIQIVEYGNAANAPTFTFATLSCDFVG